jgi:hypothetical protein
MANEGDGGKPGAGGALEELMKGFETEQLWVATRTHQGAHYEQYGENYRIAAYMEIIERMAPKPGEPKSKGILQLLRLSYGPELPYEVMVAAGKKAVELTNDLDTLVDWAQKSGLPAPVQDAAGLKAIGKAVTKEEIGAIWKMSRITSEVLVDARAAKLRGTVRPCEDGLFLEGTVRPPAGYAGRERARARMTV